MVVEIVRLATAVSAVMAPETITVLPDTEKVKEARASFTSTEDTEGVSTVKSN